MCSEDFSREIQFVELSCPLRVIRIELALECEKALKSHFSLKLTTTKRMGWYRHSLSPSL